MPKNRIHTRADGKKIYKATGKDGERNQLVQRKKESVKEFKERCEKLDERIELANGNSRITFGDLFDEWAKTKLAATSKGNEINMLDIYKTHVKKEFWHLDIDSVTTFKIYSFMQKKVEEGYSKSYISKIKRYFLSPVRWAKQNGMVADNPADGIVLSFSKKNKRTNTVNALTDEEIETFFKATEETKYDKYFKLMLYLGLRPSECLALKFSDIKGNKIHIKRAVTRHEDSDGKTRNALRIIPIPTKALEVINSIPKNSVWLFPSADGKPSFKAINAALMRVKRKTKMKVALYSFRKTFATKCAREGMQPKVLQYIMGHEKIETTLTYYVEVQEEELDSALIVLEKLYEVGNNSGNKSGENLNTESSENHLSQSGQCIA